MQYLSCFAFDENMWISNYKSLVRCWRLFMIKLWNHGLLDARSMNNCNIILEQCQSQASDRKSWKKLFFPLDSGAFLLMCWSQCLHFVLCAYFHRWAESFFHARCPAVMSCMGFFSQMNAELYYPSHLIWEVYASRIMSDTGFQFVL